MALSKELLEMVDVVQMGPSDKSTLSIIWYDSMLYASGLHRILAAPLWRYPVLRGLIAIGMIPVRYIVRKERQRLHGRPGVIFPENFPVDTHRSESLP